MSVYIIISCDLLRPTCLLCSTVQSNNPILLRTYIIGHGQIAPKKIWIFVHFNKKCWSIDLICLALNK
jgi:hypothetical protein